MSADKQSRFTKRCGISHLMAGAVLAGVATLAGCAADQDPDAAGAGQVAQAVGAVATCANWRPAGQGPLGGPNSVAAECKDVSGVFRPTEVWLPGCLANNNGSLVWAQDGFFDRSCQNCGIEAGIAQPGGGLTVAFACSCASANGNMPFARNTRINLDALTNVNGTLLCPF